jgi:hypothetical protein
MAEGITLDQLDEGVISLRKAYRRVTDAEFKALPTTGIELVAAQGAGVKLVPLFAVLDKDFTGGTYTNSAGDGWTNISVQVNNLDLLSPLANDSDAVFDDFTQFCMNAGAETVYMVPTSKFNSEAGWLNVFRWGSAVPGNAPIMLKAYNDDGNFSPGHADNFVDVTVVYIIL